MKKYVNGEYLDMTEEEIREMQENVPEIPEQGKTQGDRIEAMLVGLCSKLGVEVTE
jgi:hypothetical protein